MNNSENDFENYFYNSLKSINVTEYQNKKPYPYCAVDNALDNDLALKCQEEILSIPVDKWDRYNNPFEQKYTLRNKNDLPYYCQKVFDILTSEETVKLLSNIVGEQLYNDLSKNWWGIHTFNNGDYLKIHSDAGNHPQTKQKKHLTLGLYLSKNWKESNGGHLEVWDGSSVLNDDAKLYHCSERILPIFNRMIMFTNTTNAWHGSPNPVTITGDEKRIFLTVSYVSHKHTDGLENNREKAFFISRPNDPVDDWIDQLRLLRADPSKCHLVYNSGSEIKK